MKRTSILSALAIGLSLLVGTSPELLAADVPTAPEVSGESQQDELSRRPTDPTASQLTLSLINDVTFSYPKSDSSASHFHPRRVL